MNKIEVDLLVIAALQEELTAVLDLQDGGKAAWTQKTTPEKYTYYTTEFALDNEGKNFSLCAIAQSDMGGLNATAVVSNTLSFVKPKMACMVGICAGRRQKSIELGDVIVASHAFTYDVGKIKDGKLLSEMKNFAVHPYLKQWIQEFVTHNESWIDSVKNKSKNKDKPLLSLRYQKEYLLFKLKDNLKEGSDNQNDEWLFSQETSDNCPNYKTAIKQLEKDKLVEISDTIVLTELGKKFLASLRLEKRQNAPIPDRALPKAHYGSFASGNSVVEDISIFDELAEKDRKVLALEMEAAAFLQACYIKDTSLPAFVVKGACDYADGEKNDDFHHYAAETSAHFMLHFVRDSLPKLKKKSDESKIWAIPLETPYFTGREAVLEELQASLASERKVALTQAITGLGGIGKTQTAYRYASKFKDEYDYGFLINASSASDIIAGYFDIASKLSLYGEKEDEIIKAVKRWFERESKWLLIADNADKPNVLKGFLPTKHQGHILITSRENALEGSGVSKIIKLKVLAPEDIKPFFSKRIGKDEFSVEEEKSLNELAEELGYLPLALEQAAAYIKTREVSFSSYLSSFKQVKIALLKKDKALTEKESVATTWEINFKEIENNQAAKDLLYSIAFLAPDDIPFELLKIGGKELSPTIAEALKNVEKDPTLINDLLYPLAQYSLIQIDKQKAMFSIHRLVQEVIKDRLSEQEQREWFECIAGALLISFPRTEHVDNALCNALIFHIKELNACSKEKGFSSEQIGLLFNQSGYYCCLRARYFEAEPLYKRALGIYEKELGENHPSTATSINNLAMLYKDQGKYVEAEPLYKRALEICKKELGENHPLTATSINNLAELYHGQEKYEEAEPLLMRALEICKKELGENHPLTATIINNLAMLYHGQEKYEEAEPLLMRALEICKKELGENHPSTATSINNLAVLYYNQGKYVEAEPLYKRALEIYEKELGENHPNTAQSINNLALLYKDQGKYVEAEPLYKRALEIYEKELGENNPLTATSLNNLAGLYNAQGKYVEAEPLYKRALEIYKKELGENHPNTAQSINNLAVLYYAQGKYVEAEPVCKRALEICKKELGENHPDTAQSINNLAMLYYTQGKYIEAEPLYKRALEICKKELGENHPLTITSINNLALLYNDQGKYVEAEPLYKRALEIREKELGENHPSTATSLNNLAGLYRAQGKYKEAEPLLMRTLMVQERVLGLHHPNTTTTISNLIFFYFEQEKIEKVIFYIERAYEIMQKEFNSPNPNQAVVQPLINCFTQLKIPPFDK